MAAFNDSQPLIVEVLDSERSGLGLFRLVNAFSCTLDSGEILIVDAGYITDFASIPRLARWLICSTGKCARAALLHDWLLHKDDKRATAIFREALKAAHVSFVTRTLMVSWVWLTTYYQLHWGEPG